VIKDINKSKKIRCIDEVLSADHAKLCEKMTSEYTMEKAQRPEGILDKNKVYHDYFVWAGGRKQDKPDTSDPGIEYSCLFFSFFSH
jgi:hypothetical protein